MQIKRAKKDPARLLYFIRFGAGGSCLKYCQALGGGEMRSWLSAVMAVRLANGLSFLL
jgi:hypothetical protein